MFLHSTSINALEIFRLPVLFLNASFRLAEMAKGVDAVEFASGLCNASLTDFFLCYCVSVKMQLFLKGLIVFVRGLLFSRCNA